jgi:hypothetical protein
MDSTTVSATATHLICRQVPDWQRLAWVDIAQRVGEDSRAPERRHRIAPLATLSKGNDSPVSALLARAAGTQAAVTTATARRFAGNLFHIDIEGLAARRAAPNPRKRPRVCPIARAAHSMAALGGGTDHPTDRLATQGCSAWPASGLAQRALGAGFGEAPLLAIRAPQHIVRPFPRAAADPDWFQSTRETMGPEH